MRSKKKVYNMEELMGFVKENIISIGVIVVVVLLLLVIIELKDIDLNPPKPDSTLVQQVTVETLENMDMGKKSSLSESFCESYLGKSSELEGACNQLTKGNCATAKCCVYTGEKCVAGNKDGPTYKTDKDGKLLTMDTYYYLGKCRGVRCPT